MKRYLSSLLVITLFLSNFSAFAMRKKIEEEEERTTQDMYLDFGGADETELCELPDCRRVPYDVVFYVIVPFLNNKTFMDMRLVCKSFKKGLDAFVVYVSFKEYIKEGVTQELLTREMLNFKKIRETKKETERKIKMHGSVRVYCKDSQDKAKMVIWDKENFDQVCVLVYLTLSRPK